MRHPRLAAGSGQAPRVAPVASLATRLRRFRTPREPARSGRPAETTSEAFARPGCDRDGRLSTKHVSTTCSSAARRLRTTSAASGPSSSSATAPRPPSPRARSVTSPCERARRAVTPPARRMSGRAQVGRRSFRSVRARADRRARTARSGPTARRGVHPVRRSCRAVRRRRPGATTGRARPRLGRQRREPPIAGTG